MSFKLHHMQCIKLFLTNRKTSKQPSVHKYIEDTGSKELADKYNDCITAFRNCHVGLVKDYIIQQSNSRSELTSKGNRWYNKIGRTTDRCMKEL